jgi:1-phosphofructokinase family hexose kinase
MVLTVTLNACVDKAIFIGRMRKGKFNNGTWSHDVGGGKGANAARMLHRLGVPVRPLIILGGRSGQRVADQLREEDGMDPIVVWTKAPTRTIVTIREQDIGVNTAFVEPSPDVTQEEVQRLMQEFAQAVKNARIVTFGGSAPCKSLEGVYAEMIEIAKAKGVCTILDSRDAALRNAIPARPFMVKPNAAESENLLGRRFESGQLLWRAVEWYRSQGIQAVVLTMGRKGALADWESKRWVARPPRVETVNPVGSGDCLVGGIAAGLYWGWEPGECLRLGVACGAANAAVWDPAYVTREQVEALLDKVKLRPV